MRIAKLMSFLVLLLFTATTSAGEATVSKHKGATLKYRQTTGYHEHCIEFSPRPKKEFLFVSLLVGPTEHGKASSSVSKSWRGGSKLETNSGREYQRFNYFPIDEGAEKHFSACLTGTRQQLAIIQVMYGYDQEKKEAQFFEVRDIVGKFGGAKAGSAPAETRQSDITHPVLGAVDDAKKDVQREAAVALLGALLGRDKSPANNQPVEVDPSSVPPPPTQLVPGLSGDPNPHAFPQPTKIRYFAPDAALMTGIGQFLSVGAPFTIHAVMQAEHLWGQHIPFCTTAHAAWPVSSFSLNLPLPISRELTLQASGTARWEITKYSVFRRSDGLYDHRWSAKRSGDDSNYGDDRGTGKYDVSFCLRDLKKNDVHAKPHIENMVLGLYGRSGSVIYLPDPHSRKFRTPHDAAIQETTRTFRPGALALVSGVDRGEIDPATLIADRANQPAPPIQSAASVAPVNTGVVPPPPSSHPGSATLGGGPLDIRYSIEQRGREALHCFDVHNPTGQAVAEIEIGIGPVPIPFESGQGMQTRDKLVDWNAAARYNGPEGRQTLRFAPAGWAKGKPAASRAHIGKACFTTPAALASRMPDMRTLQYSTRFH